jgi:hypothetical protein
MLHRFPVSLVSGTDLSACVSNILLQKAKLKIVRLSSAFLESDELAGIITANIRSGYYGPPENFMYVFTHVAQRRVPYQFEIHVQANSSGA